MLSDEGYKNHRSIKLSPVMHFIYREFFFVDFKLPGYLDPHLIRAVEFLFDFRDKFKGQFDENMLFLRIVLRAANCQGKVLSILFIFKFKLIQYL